MTYAVWTYYQGSISARIFKGTKKECKDYIKQAVKKGEDPKRLIIQKVTIYG